LPGSLGEVGTGEFDLAGSLVAGDRADRLMQQSQLLTLQLKLRHGSAFVVASDNAELIEGAHADSIMYVFDESKAISPDTFDAVEGVLTGVAAESESETFALAMSPPAGPDGRF
jgi:hypothetical protein